MTTWAQIEHANHAAEVLETALESIECDPVTVEAVGTLGPVQIEVHISPDDAIHLARILRSYK